MIVPLEAIRSAADYGFESRLGQTKDYTKVHDMFLE
jgi:hypothetical protein